MKFTTKTLFCIIRGKNQSVRRRIYDENEPNVETAIITRFLAFSSLCEAASRRGVGAIYCIRRKRNGNEAFRYATLIYADRLSESLVDDGKCIGIHNGK